MGVIKPHTCDNLSLTSLGASCRWHRAHSAELSQLRGEGAWYLSTSCCHSRETEQAPETEVSLMCAEGCGATPRASAKSLKRGAGTAPSSLEGKCRRFLPSPFCSLPSKRPISELRSLKQMHRSSLFVHPGVLPPEAALKSQCEHTANCTKKEDRQSCLMSKRGSEG